MFYHKYPSSYHHLKELKTSIISREYLSTCEMKETDIFFLHFLFKLYPYFCKLRIALVFYFFLKTSQINLV